MPNNKEIYKPLKQENENKGESLNKLFQQQVNKHSDQEIQEIKESLESLHKKVNRLLIYFNLTKKDILVI